MNARKANHQNPAERIMEEFYAGRIDASQVFGLMLLLGVPSDDDRLGWFLGKEQKHPDLERIQQAF